ncbi:MAG: hypothetical protein Q4A93_03180 [Actinomycetota bacterium]|nr:hypothetical protein [Actinomycetota bacterium]
MMMNGCVSDNIYPELLTSGGKVRVVLPEWVDALVFDRYGATHNPAGRKRTFDSNLESDKAGVLTYLGTYFPRSLAETFVIFDSLLSDKNLASSLAYESSINICSVGTGTGGDLLGLILAINKWVPTAKQLNIVSIEGNTDAHEIMRGVIGEAQARTGKNIGLNLVNHVFVAPKPFDYIREFMPRHPQSFDFVISSKMLNELDKARVSEQPYYEFCSAFTAMLKPTGVLMALDVTSPNGAGGRWTPTLLNGQVNEFLANRSQFKTILPLLCNRFEGGCGRDCYTQNAIYVNYRGVTNECSKICYRVIGSAELAEKLSGSVALWSCPITEDNRTHCLEFNGAD